MQPRFVIVGISVAVVALGLLFTLKPTLDTGRSEDRDTHPISLPKNALETQQSTSGPKSPVVTGLDGDVRFDRSKSPQAPSHSKPPPAPSEEELLEQSLAKLKKGNLAYNTPEKMKSGHTAHVTARIGSEKVSVQTLKSGMPTDQGTMTETAATPVSTKMKMTLKSADFDITPLSSEEQIVAGDIPTQWEWDISPKHSGKARLHLAAIVELNQLSRDFTTVDRDITVQVDPVDAAETFVKNNLVWILGTLGTAIAAGWAWWKRRKKPKVPAWQVP